MSALTALLDPCIALVAGVLAGIAPCALTANIAAIAYVSQRASDPRKTILAGALYALGRVIVYSVIGLAVLLSGIALADRIQGIHSVLSLALAAIFLLAGAIILGAVRLNWAAGQGLIAKHADPQYEKGAGGAFALGLLFALAFCPVTAAIFFGTLVPLTFEAGSIGAALPPIFGIGTALPVFAFACLLASGVSRARDFADRVRAVEPRIRKLFGAGLVVYGAFLFISSIS